MGTTARSRARPAPEQVLPARASQVVSQVGKRPIAKWQTPKFHSNPDYAKREKERWNEDKAIMNTAKSMATKDDLTTVSPPATSLALDCSWKRAQNNAINLRVLSKGPAAIGLNTANASAWGVWFRRFFVERV